MVEEIIDVTAPSLTYAPRQMAFMKRLKLSPVDFGRYMADVINDSETASDAAVKMGLQKGTFWNWCRTFRVEIHTYALVEGDRLQVVRTPGAHR